MDVTEGIEQIRDYKHSRGYIREIAKRALTEITGLREKVKLAKEILEKYPRSGHTELEVMLRAALADDGKGE